MERPPQGVHLLLPQDESLTWKCFLCEKVEVTDGWLHAVKNGKQAEALPVCDAE